jgi:hypothetical protein
MGAAMRSAHEIATRAIGGIVYVVVIKDFSDGSSKFSVAYQSKASRWLSRHRFPDIIQAEAGVVCLADYLGAEVRL